MSQTLSSRTLSLPSHSAGLGAASLAPDVKGPCGAVDSSELLRGNKTVEIQHNGLIYRLQATRLGKLILTK
ncbi:MAG TPA: hemin uptake protein HemP [Polaromonas sp.]|uniref:hemin uptake protein HemP n=1 Tax=Polaromonas sp. TaxID=1869339 RepID=UPI002D5579E5|nr:hemin uptake protein HemP [Polaromonas sp.]HYW57959.1 hemin uptake protein HemP [Polaromonas sp.]